jgi:hypothetical protein
MMKRLVSNAENSFKRYVASLGYIKERRLTRASVAMKHTCGHYRDSWMALSTEQQLAISR